MKEDQEKTNKREIKKNHLIIRYWVKSTFECGFDPISNNHTPFSVYFFIISLIFLIFDTEITLLISSIFN